MKKRFGIVSGSVSDRGDFRSENQDSLLCFEGEVEGQTAGLFVVADGMGGLSRGADVSRYISGQFENWMAEDFPAAVRAGFDRKEDILELLEQEIWDLNQEILDFRAREQCSAGSTLSILLTYGAYYYIKNIGDSRIYLLRDGDFEQLTEDQSVAARMVRAGELTEEEAKYSGKKHVLTMCMGMFQQPVSGTVSGVLYRGDQFLLCSDGLYNSLEGYKMREILLEDCTAQEKADRLRQAIAPMTAADNVSVIVVGIK